MSLVEPVITFSLFQVEAMLFKKIKKIIDIIDKNWIA